ncbi:tail fiber domain-containing protein [Emticicia agri]|uniref:Peptidase S74 domain-containing protein n=1 Tax=Emticicia agri TaxID=2492393 RepID=A0A4Q5LTH9_9BACT|nr:tail fiber domain-containing protein [Emticicia agri]RYU92723.1 hypothetical protein EWM59_25635 [Emticicia agri]
MKTTLLIFCLVIGVYQMAHAQSATVLPTSGEVYSNNTGNNASAIKGVMTNSTSNTFNAAVRGEHLGAEGYGMGVYGSHGGLGYGVFGISGNGIGVYGESSNSSGLTGYSNGSSGIVGLSNSGSAGFLHSIAADNVAPVLELNHSGIGRGILIRLNNATNAANGLFIDHLGTGTGAHIRKFDTSGLGAGLIAEKRTPYTGNYTTDPHAELEVRHGDGGVVGMSGLRIVNTGPNLNNWTLWTSNTNGSLLLMANGIIRGSFNPSTGAYTPASDIRLKHNIKNYSPTLTNLLKIGIKSYQVHHSAKAEVGLLAQEVLQYFPELIYDGVDEKGEQRYFMDYARIGVLAVKGIQEQQSIIDKQQSKIQTLEKEVQLLRNEMNELKKMLMKGK